MAQVIARCAVLACVLCASIAGAQGTAAFVGVSSAPGFGYDPGLYARIQTTGEHWAASITASAERKFHATSGYTAQASVTGRVAITEHTFAGAGVYRSQYNTGFNDGSGWAKTVTVPQIEAGYRERRGEVVLAYQRGPSHWGYVSTVGAAVSVMLGEHLAAQWDVRYADGYAGRLGVGWRF